MGRSLRYREWQQRNCANPFGFLVFLLAIAGMTAMTPFAGFSQPSTEASGKMVLKTEPGSSDMSSTPSLHRGDPYPLGICAMCEMDLTVIARPFHSVYEGRDLAFCCPKCEATLRETPDPYLPSLDAKTIALQKPHYPLDTCVVSGKRLEEADKVVDTLVGNRLVRLCSEDCIAELKHDSGKYLSMLDKAVLERDRGTYPLDHCVVCEMSLDTHGKPVETVFAHRLVRLCSEECLKRFELNPTRYWEAMETERPAMDGSHSKTGMHEGSSEKSAKPSETKN